MQISVSVVNASCQAQNVRDVTRIQQCLNLEPLSTVEIRRMF